MNILSSLLRQMLMVMLLVFDQRLLILSTSPFFFLEILLKGQGDWDTQTSYSLKLGAVFYSEPENKRSDQVEYRSDRVHGVPGGGSLRSEAWSGLDWRQKRAQGHLLGENVPVCLVPTCVCTHRDLPAFVNIYAGYQFIAFQFHKHLSSLCWWCLN